MTETLLHTKLFIPTARPKVVHRPRLVERLNEGLHRKLTLISAPAGFGKTTLVTEWLDTIQPDAKNRKHTDPGIAWLSLDEGDNDLVRFLTYLVSAVNQVEGFDTKIGKGTLSLLQSPQPPPAEAILISLINECTTTNARIILVLDDYHLVETQAIHDGLRFFLENTPPQMHLVINTREDPNFPLGQLRAKDQITELRAIDLRFTSAEATEFLNQVMELNLLDNDIIALETRTEGWIAGLQLAAISLQGHKETSSLIKSFTGTHRFILDYLIEEVLNQQPEVTQNFLLQTAILDRLTGSLCDALTGQENGQMILEMLDHNNLFIIPLDEERRWYRYHHLFADLLRQQLLKNYPERQPVLHQLASKWYEEQGDSNDAIYHALMGADYERAADLIEIFIGDNYEQASQLTLQGWLAKIPKEFVSAKPQLCLLQAWNLLTIGNLEAVDQSLQVAEKLLGTIGQHTEVSQKKLIGRAATIRSLLAYYSGDYSGVIQFAQRAIEVLPKEEQAWRSMALLALGDAYASLGQMNDARLARSEALAMGKSSGDIYILMIANLGLAEALWQQGQLKQVVEICERQLKSAEENGIAESAIAGLLLGLWGAILAEFNDLGGAIDLARKGAELADRSHDVTFIISCNLRLVRVLFSAGDLEGAEEVVQEMADTTQEYDLPFWASYQLSSWQVRIWLAQGKLELASKWVGEHGLDIDGDPTYLQEMEYIAFARILIAQGKLDEAAKLLQHLGEAAQAGGRTTRLIEIILLQALAFQEQEVTANAISKLERALSLAAPEGFVRIFLDEGSPMEALLKKIKPEDVRMKRYLHKLRTAFSDSELHPAALSPQPLIEPLSEREIEILQLIAEGLTNQEIANRLYLSLNTVKVHTRNINGKLGTHSRTKAVAKARLLGILPSG